MLAGSRHTILLGGAGAGKSALVAAVVAEGAKAALAGRRQKVFTVSIAAADLAEQSWPVRWRCPAGTISSWSCPRRRSIGRRCAADVGAS
jgi:hypothetical protein